ncbi:MAG: topoisomerase DNA-binding C4 zinc finger domain-containing protein, partial [Candidatus Zixiibacteriota bacterium]
PECGMKLVPADETSGRTVYECPMPQDSVVSAEPGRCPKCGMKLVEREIINKEKTEKEQKEKKADMEMEASGVYTCPMDSHSHIVQHGPGECPDCGMKLVPAEETSGRTYYTCSMSECEIVTNEPGRCPKCGMKLEKREIKGSNQSGHMDMEEHGEATTAPSGYYTCPMDSHAHVVQHGPGECPECGMKLVAAEETSGRSFYICPCGGCREIVSNDSGDCPKCGMAMVEKTVKSAKQ